MRAPLQQSIRNVSRGQQKPASAGSSRNFRWWIMAAILLISVDMMANNWNGLWNAGEDTDDSLVGVALKHEQQGGGVLKSNGIRGAFNSSLVDTTEKSSTASTSIKQHHGHHHTPDHSEAVHVVLSCDNSLFVALQALVQSMISNTQLPHLLHLHIFQIEHLQGYATWRKNVHQSGAHIHLYTLEPHELDPYINPHLAPDQQRLKSHANFVRFILADRLDIKIQSCLWLDADIIVQGDLVEWMHQNQPITKSLAAFPRFRVPYSFRNESFYPLFAQHNISGIANQEEPTFNAGIMYINLHLWRQQQIDQTIRQICQLNQEHPIYNNSGSQSPLLLVFAGDGFERLNVSHSISYLGDSPLTKKKRRPQEGVMFLHWNGPNKPWFTNGLNTKYWKPYAPPGFRPIPNLHKIKQKKMTMMKQRKRKG
eukprot:CAMPEP_0172446688 /NCGR_PEP_ID=MMETSP1065-20121228/6246_1 /TAXON_ID=265537 /ORGANISM="Amphiprora paludosa, Strain CCMP125" /LENGTH=423 /DNA_ID=CAMNT_0013197877 /DNA_START=41 /DNA_END=1312 /DNA_ORIENTATION=-